MFIGLGQAGLAPFAHPGAWNDPDMLEVGNGGMTTDEYRTHMSLWALLAAPLLAGNDLTKMTAETLSILTNRDVIAIDQDALGKQGDRVWSEGPLELWAKPLSGGAKAIGLFNTSEAPVPFEFAYKDIGMTPRTVRDVWAGTDIKPDGATFKTLVPKHGVVLLRVER